MDGIGGEPILLFEISHGDAEFFGDFPERVASFDSVNIPSVGSALPAGQGEAAYGASDELAELTAIKFHTENASFPKNSKTEVRGNVAHVASIFKSFLRSEESVAANGGWRKAFSFAFDTI